MQEKYNNKIKTKKLPRNYVKIHCSRKFFCFNKHNGFCKIPVCLYIYLLLVINELIECASISGCINFPQISITGVTFISEPFFISVITFPSGFLNAIISISWQLHLIFTSMRFAPPAIKLLKCFVR